MLPAGASSWILGGGKETPSVASAWDPGSVSARHAGLHTFSIYLFAYDSLCMMNKLAVVEVLGAGFLDRTKLPCAVMYVA
jgi:hypothetical protein